MPGKDKTPTFILELQLAASIEDDRRLAARVECGKRLSNTVLQDGFSIVEKMRSDPAWSDARKMPKRSDEDKQRRFQAFKAVRQTHGFTKEDFDALAIKHKNAAGFSDRIGADETQRIGERVFKALERWVLGQRGRPRFKGRQRPLHSLEGKTNEGVLQWYNPEHKQGGRLLYNALLPIALPIATLLKEDPDFPAAWQLPKGDKVEKMALPRKRQRLPAGIPRHKRRHPSIRVFDKTAQIQVLNSPPGKGSRRGDLESIPG